MRILHGILAVIFLLFSFLQLNDPDPYIWILIYGSMAVVCVLAIFRMYYPKIMIVMLIAFAAYSLVAYDGVVEWLKQDDKAVIFDDVAKMQYPYIEYSREFLGLWICNLVLIGYLFASRKKS
jgi:hypothetical protein